LSRAELSEGRFQNVEEIKSENGYRINSIQFNLIQFNSIQPINTGIDAFD